MKLTEAHSIAGTLCRATPDGQRKSANECIVTTSLVSDEDWEIWIGANSYPSVCARPEGHYGPHDWEDLPTFVHRAVHEELDRCIAALREARP